MALGRPVFVVGSPRTGTTLAKEILNRHPRIHLLDEVHFFERILDDRARLGDLSEDASLDRAIERIRWIVAEYGSDPLLADVLGPDVYRDRVRAAGGDYRALLEVLLRTGADLKHADFWGDSSPQDILYLSTILRWFPDARIVALIRDPRAFLASYKNYHRREVSTYRERYNPITNSLLWRSYMTALLEARGEPWGAAVHELRYEDLVADPEAHTRLLCDHIGVEYDPAMVVVDSANTSFGDEAASGTAAGIFTDSRDRWRTELTKTEVWIGERVFGGVMEELGFARSSRSGMLPPSLPETARILSLIPVRLFNMLFRGLKPVRISKIRRVFTLFRRR
ncbi:MAG: sulfotransferase [Gemmatimonadota bacterium]|nr:hypothetical protein [Gemmatimonadota bacterium]MDP6529049.1 sulfotransferase [Gemmatimonadota bacterium]MDP6802653.1 sulfotransferase [Gemmatimonadota bacterium]MDP7031652.1 sulfotransferase [Gemmatimonadota bacterium]